MVETEALRLLVKDLMGRLKAANEAADYAKKVSAQLLEEKRALAAELEVARLAGHGS